MVAIYYWGILFHGSCEGLEIKGGSWDSISTVISTLIEVISNYKYSYRIYNPS